MKESIKRYALIPVILLFIFIFGDFYLDGLRGEIIHVYHNDGYFRDMVVTDGYLWVQKDYPDYSRINTENGDNTTVSFEPEKCVNIFDDPELCQVVSDTDLSQQRTIFSYSDRPEEFYGILDSPLWEADAWAESGEFFYSLSAAPVYHLQVRERIAMFRRILGERLNVEKRNEGFTMYEIPFASHEFEHEIDTDDYLYFAVCGKDKKMLSEVFLRPDDFDVSDVYDVGMFVRGRSITLLIVTGDGIYRYFSHDSGRSFDFLPEIINIEEDSEISMSSSERFIVITEFRDDILKIHHSEDMGVSFSETVIATESAVMDVAVSDNLKKAAVLHSDGNRDHISVFSLAGSVQKIYMTGNIFPQSLAAPDFLNDGSLIYARQKDDDEFEIRIVRDLSD
ncbi:MAG: hypothetical protein ACOCWO_01695 [Candidatus Muiribacteriaceae bacterium]